jgi:hypothetical protein
MGTITLTSQEENSVTGTIPDIIANANGLYLGNLRYYFQILFRYAKNLEVFYHNFRHMMHVMYLCYLACVFYRDVLTPRRMRNLLIGAIFHDFDHRGTTVSDAVNIARALAGLRRHILPRDRPELPNIEKIVEASEFPHKEDASLSLEALMLRDADLAQVFNPAWVQQIVFGLAREKGISPHEMLEGQEKFLKSLHFETEWARQKFPRCVIDAKIEEIRGYLDVLSPNTI